MGDRDLIKPLLERSGKVREGVGCGAGCSLEPSGAVYQGMRGGGGGGQGLETSARQGSSVAAALTGGGDGAALTGG